MFDDIIFGTDTVRKSRTAFRAELLRKEAGLTIPELARKARVSEVFIEKLERGNTFRGERVGDLRAIAKALGHPIARADEIRSHVSADELEAEEHDGRVRKRLGAGLFDDIVNCQENTPTNSWMWRERARAAESVTKYRPLKRLVKRADEQRYTLGVAYPANQVDAQGEYADAEEVEKAAWKFLENPQVGVMHKFGTEGAGRVVESYIYRGPDWDSGDQVVKEGDWLMGVVWEPEAWELIKRGELNGFSIQGWAERRASD
ncbi:MAG TPA: XkdF-like putative serine protease domain-containing protein [Candidatus Polarisedimenticolia bacterium]|nr:XkdF-like putative serine protease domain-containing protein [Candidatus Polarisedimenticolia bacterium]